MQLLVAHQILIASALALSLLFGARAAVLFARGDGAANLWLAIGAFVVAAGLGLYLRKVRARWVKLRDERGSK